MFFLQNDEYLQQAKEVLSYYKDFAMKSQGTAEKVNFNFMARGEPLSNIYLRDNAKFLINENANIFPVFSCQSLICLSDSSTDNDFGNHLFLNPSSTEYKEIWFKP